MDADDEAGGPMTDWWARFERDAAFRQATIDAYEGRHDVADAVWWVEHPESDAPSGAPAALAPLADLQRAAFARPGDAAGADRTVGHLRELEAFRAMLAADRSETLAALDAAQAVLDARPAQRRRVGLLVGGLAAAVCVAGALAFGAVAVFAPGGSAGAFPGFGGAVASPGVEGGAGGASPGASEDGADGDGSAGGSSTGGGGSSYGATLGDPEATDGTAGIDGGADGDGGTGSGAPEPALTAAPYPNFPPGTGASSFADVFAQEQGAADLPPEPLPEGLVGETFRVLSVGENTTGAVYVAVSTESMVCLVVYGSPLEYTYSCDTASGVGAHGLQSSISTRDRKDPATGVLHSAIALSARLQPDGTFTLDRSTPYARG